MKQLILFLVITVVGISYALPVTKTEPKKVETSEEEPGSDVEVVVVLLFLCYV